MIFKKCIMTITNNTAKLDEDIYLYRLDKNVDLYFTIVNSKYKFNKSDMNNIIELTKAAYFQVRLYKNAQIKYVFAIQPTDNGDAILRITEDLIDEPIEVGDYDLQISLLDEEKQSMVSMPIVSKQFHVCEPLVSEDALTGKALLGLSKAGKGEIKNAFDKDGNYIREIHANGEVITAELFNKWEETLEQNTKSLNEVKAGSSYDDTQVKQDINTIKATIGTVELTTTDKTLKGGVNELSSQIKDIVNYSIDNIYGLNNMQYKINDIVELKGYYEKGDSNKHLRIIESEDDGSGIEISNNLFANILHSGVVECEWFGVICKNESDYRNAEMQKFLNYIKTEKAKKFNLGSNDIYLNEPMELVFNSTGGGFTIESNGAKMIFTLTEEKPCLKIGLDTTSYSSLSNVTLRNIEIKANGNQSHGLKLYTNGMNTLAFWNSLFENIKVSVNKGKGVGIYNGVFECRFKGLRIDHKRKARENEDGVLLTSDDIGLYLANEPNNNIISSLQFDYVNIWGGYHSIKTEGLNGRYAPDFSCNECHVFDSKMEALLLQNQQHYNYLKKVHMEFIGTTENPVWGIKWIGYGMIDGVEGGSDGLLGFVRVHNGYKNVMRVNNLATPLALNSNSKGYLFPHTETGGNIETDCELSNIHIPDYCTGTLICNVNNRKATVKLTGNSKRLDIILNTENGVTYTKNEGIDNNAIYTNINAYGIYGGKTNTTDMDFSNKSNVIRYDLGHGVQNNVKLGFYGQSPIQKPVIQGSDGGNLALRQLLSALSLLGLIDNSTSQG